MLRGNPNYASAYYTRGNAYYALGELEAASADYIAAVNLNPNLANGLFQ